jgi:adenylate cyclase
MANLEIERKFTVDDSWEPPEGTPCSHLRQAYLTDVGARVEARVRAADEVRLMTFKAANVSGNSMVRKEIEFPIEPEVFEQLWELSDGEALSKVRWHVPLGDLEASVDIYEGTLQHLRVVEVEFESVEQAEAFVPPPWFGREVTGTKEWNNRRLAASARERDRDGDGDGDAQGQGQR